MKTFLLPSSTQSNPITSILLMLLSKRKSRKHANDGGKHFSKNNFRGNKTGPP